MGATLDFSGSVVAMGVPLLSFGMESLDAVAEMSSRFRASALRVNGLVGESLPSAEGDIDDDDIRRSLHALFGVTLRSSVTGVASPRSSSLNLPLSEIDTRGHGERRTTASCLISLRHVAGVCLVALLIGVEGPCLRDCFLVSELFGPGVSESVLSELCDLVHCPNCRLPPRRGLLLVASAKRVTRVAGGDNVLDFLLVEPPMFHYVSVIRFTRICH